MTRSQEKYSVRKENGVTIGSNCNNVKHALLKQVQKLIHAQAELYKLIVQQVDSQQSNQTTCTNYTFGIEYHLPNPKLAPTVHPVTQEEEEIPYQGHPTAYHTFYQTPRNTAFISQQALYNLLRETMCHATEHFTPQCLKDANIYNTHTPFKEVANGVVHPDTQETITIYNQLINDPVLQDVWLKSMCIELGRLSNGYKDTKGTQTIHYMTYE